MEEIFQIYILVGYLIGYLGLIKFRLVLIWNNNQIDNLISMISSFNFAPSHQIKNEI